MRCARSARLAGGPSFVCVLLCLSSAALACAGPDRDAGRGRAPASDVALDPVRSVLLCAHGVPEGSCVECHPELTAGFKARGDWCPEHDVPESQCLLCHPNLEFSSIPDVPDGADLAHLSRHGEDVPSLEAHAALGKVTVFDFYADWCGPCREIDAFVHRLLAKRQDLAYRKINIGSWETPVAKRYLRNVPTLPYVVIYGKDQKRVRDISGVDFDALHEAVEEGLAR